jgi:hypothetical protein
MITIEQFKAMHNVSKLSFYKSKETNRHVAGVGLDGMLITSEDFDSTKPCFVYSNPKDATSKSWILSNTEPKEAAFTL